MFWPPKPSPFRLQHSVPYEMMDCPYPSEDSKKILHQAPDVGAMVQTTGDEIREAVSGTKAALPKNVHIQSLDRGGEAVMDIR